MYTMTGLEILAAWWIRRKIKGYIMRKLAKEIALGAVRHSLTAFGLLFVNLGLATQDEANAFVGALGIVVGFVWSAARKWKRAR